MIQINKQINDLFGLGQCAYIKLNDNKKRETIEIIFTKGKLDLLTNEIERINVYNESINVIKRDKSSIFINLNQVTQIN